MKTMLIHAPSKNNNHVGEEYDNLLEVPEIPDVENIQQVSEIIRNRIRKLWHEMTEDDTARKVAITLDGHAVYATLLINLQQRMKPEEGIVVELLGNINQGPRDIQDSETQEILQKMGGQFAKVG